MTSPRTLVTSALALVFLFVSSARAQQPVTWTNLVNATASGPTIQKTGGCDGCQDAGGVTQQQIGTGTGSFQFSPGTGQELYVGLTRTTVTPLFYSQLEYAFAIYPDSVCEIREGGVWRADCAFAAGDVLRIAIDAGPVVNYYRNGGLLYSSTTAPSDFPYVLGADLFNLGATVANAQIVTTTLVVPTKYAATTNRNIYPEPKLPKLGNAGFKFRDPTFGSRMLRVTDANTRPGLSGRSYTAASSAQQLAWNAASNLFYVRSIDGTFIPYTFNATKMTAARIDPTTTGDGGLVIRSQVEPQFSLRSANLLFGSRQDSANDWPIIQQFDFATLTYTDIVNLGALTTIASGTFAGALSSSASTPEELCVLFGGSAQDAHYKVAVVQTTGTSPIVLDSVASTITSNGVTTSTNIPLGVYLHHAWIEQSGRYVLLYPVNQQPVPYYIWDVATATITAVNTNATGHDATGYRWKVNQGCCTTTSWDAAQWQARPLGSSATTRDLINPVLTPQRNLSGRPFVLDQRAGGHARADPLVPLSLLQRHVQHDTVAGLGR
jgi:hypothetical protein